MASLMSSMQTQLTALTNLVAAGGHPGEATMLSIPMKSIEEFDRIEALVEDPACSTQLVGLILY